MSIYYNGYRRPSSIYLIKSQIISIWVKFHCDYFKPNYMYEVSCKKVFIHYSQNYTKKTSNIWYILLYSIVNLPIVYLFDNIKTAPFYKCKIGPFTYKILQFLFFRFEWTLVWTKNVHYIYKRRDFKHFCF